MPRAAGNQSAVNLRASAQAIRGVIANGAQDWKTALTAIADALDAVQLGLELTEAKHANLGQLNTTDPRRPANDFVSGDRLINGIKVNGFVVDPYTGRIGVGTTAPSSIFQISMGPNSNFNVRPFSDFFVGQPGAAIDVGSSASLLFQAKNTLIIGNLQLDLSRIIAYANNAAAIAGGLVGGNVYRTGADPSTLCVVF
jgi:hypothetical protein